MGKNTSKHGPAQHIHTHPLHRAHLQPARRTRSPVLTTRIDYVQRNRNKKVIYRSFVTNSWTNLVVGSSFNALVNSGIMHPTAVLICPFIAASTTSGLTDFQWKSPFDTCPATMSPLSLTNLQVLQPKTCIPGRLANEMGH